MQIFYCNAKLLSTLLHFQMAAEREGSSGSSSGTSEQSSSEDADKKEKKEEKQ